MILIRYSGGISILPRDGQSQWNLVLYELGPAGMYSPVIGLVQLLTC